MAYTGIACATAFNNTSLPPTDSILSFHPLILWIILSTKCRKHSLLSAPTIAGSPRYLSEIASVLILRISQISTFTRTLVFGEKKILYFATLTNCPKLAQ
jgi:hypothetical protein